MGVRTVQGSALLSAMLLRLELRVRPMLQVRLLLLSGTKTFMPGLSANMLRVYMSKLTTTVLSIIENDRIPALRATAEAITIAYVDALRRLNVPGVGDSPVCAEAFVKKVYKDISKKTKLFFKTARSLYVECSMIANRIMDESQSLSVFDLHTDRLDNMISEIVKIISQTCDPGFKVPEITRTVCADLIRRFQKITKELEMVGMVWQRDESKLSTPKDALRKQSRRKSAKKGGRRRKRTRQKRKKRRAIK